VLPEGSDKDLAPQSDGAVAAASVSKGAVANAEVRID